MCVFLIASELLYNFYFSYYSVILLIHWPGLKQICFLAFMCQETFVFACRVGWIMYFIIALWPLSQITSNAYLHCSDTNLCLTFFCVGKNFGGSNEIYSVFIWSNFPGSRTRVLPWPIGIQRGGWSTSRTVLLWRWSRRWENIAWFPFSVSPSGERRHWAPGFSLDLCYAEGYVMHKDALLWERLQQLCMLDWLQHGRLKERGKPLHPLGWRKDLNFPLSCLGKRKQLVITSRCKLLLAF